MVVEQFNTLTVPFLNIASNDLANNAYDLLGRIFRNKRQKYETSRPFTDEEKVEVILKAIEVIHLDLPAIRSSAIKNLNKFDFKFESIIFSPSDDELIKEENNHEINSDRVDTEESRYRELHENFMRELGK